MSYKFADVAVPIAVNKTFLYEVPERLRAKIAVGVRAIIPFGRKLASGYVVALKESSDLSGRKLKPIVDILDAQPLLSPEMLELTRWISDHYFAPWGMVIKGALPAAVNVSSVAIASITEAGRKVQAEHFASGPDSPPARYKILAQLAARSPLSVKDLAKALKVKSLNSALNELEKEGLVAIDYQIKLRRPKGREVTLVRLREPSADGPAELSAKQAAALEKIRALHLPMPIADLAKAAGCSRALIKSLARKGALELLRETALRAPVIGLEGVTLREHELTRDQQAAFSEILKGLNEGGHRVYLLHGVTGSGKTEIYMRAIREVLRRGFSALMLVPEIALTPQVSQLFSSAFGPEVAILHSALSQGERSDEWWRVKEGLARVVVGTRSAIFAPLRDLKLIIIDEEHDHSYKQEEAPRYHARDVALRRSELAGAVVILGSATPSLETYHAARYEGKISYLALETRVLDRPLPEVEVVDMREEFRRTGRAAIISTKLRQAIHQRLKNKEQVLILLNRRGYSHVVLCRSCGNTINCDECSIAMTFHREDNRLICHYCASTKPAPERCPVCDGEYIYYIGEGTERIEEMMRQLFPAARIDRMDRDTTRHKLSYHRILSQFARGETDILIGTQMIAKGHDFPRVTLVGVIAADSGLALPDFRAAERTFQLLTQVAGRSGRGQIAGQVIIQTYYPNHYSLKFAREQNYDEFYQHESRFRQLMHYPPFTHLANILVKDRDLQRTVRIARKVVKELLSVRAQTEGGQAVRILGPAPAPLERIKGQYRYQILLKSLDEGALHKILAASYANLLKQRVGIKKVSIDVDPMTIM